MWNSSENYSSLSEKPSKSLNQLTKTVFWKFRLDSGTLHRVPLTKDYDENANVSVQLRKMTADSLADSGTSGFKMKQRSVEEHRRKWRIRCDH